MNTVADIKVTQFNTPTGLKERFVFVTRTHGRMSAVLRMFVGLYCLAKEGYDREKVMLMAEHLLYGSYSLHGHTDGDITDGHRLARKLLGGDDTG